ncbi:MAG: hypothetical protein ACYCTI_08210 [Acidimicrobiales bacterium]
MTAALLAIPGLTAGLCLILFATPWLERLIDSPEPSSSSTVQRVAAEHLKGRPVEGIIGDREQSPSYTSV